MDPRNAIYFENFDELDDDENSLTEPEDEL